MNSLSQVTVIDSLTLAKKDGIVSLLINSSHCTEDVIKMVADMNEISENLTITIDFEPLYGYVN